MGRLMAIDAKDYVKQKQAGKVRVGDVGPDNAATTLIKVAGNVFLIQKKWNPDTGDEIAPYMTQVDLDSLKKQRDQLQVG